MQFQRWMKFLFIVVLCVQFDAYFVPANAERVFRICQIEPLEGRWENTSKKLVKQQVSALQIFGVCQGALTNLKVRVELECGRTPCQWRAARIKKSQDGRLFASLETFLAQRFVILSVEKIEQGKLEAQIISQFFSANRPQERQKWEFVKVEK